MDNESFETVEEEQLIDKPQSDAHALQHIFSGIDESVSSAVLTAEDLLKELLEKIVGDDNPEESVHSVLVTVDNLIENAFGNYPSKNVTVHFKTLQTVLLVIANQLQVLKRQVKLDLGNITSEELMNIKPTVSITQLTVHTRRVPKKKKKKATPQKKCRVCNQKRTCLSCLGDVNGKRQDDKKRNEKVLVGSQDLYGNSMVTVAELADLEEYVQLLEDTTLDAESKQISELIRKLQAAEAELQTMNDKATKLYEMQLLRREMDICTLKHAVSRTSLNPQISTNEIEEDAEYVSIKDFKTMLKTLRNEVQQLGTHWTKQSTVASNMATNILLETDKKLAEIPDPNESLIAEIEAAVAAYVSKINSFDSIVSSKMSEFQEELHETQHVLETSLEVIAEAMSNPSGHEQAYTELYGRCRKVQLEIRALDLAQQELQEFQRSLVVDLEKLINELEIIDAAKSARGEVESALAGKAGLAALNGLITREQFDSIRSYYEKNILTAYDKFNSQENTWQKSVDILHRELDDKMENNQVEAIREDIIQHMLNLHHKAEKLQEIVGDLRLPAGKTRLARDDDCFSCSAPPFLPN